MVDDGLTWNRAWQQAEQETGIRRKSPWPYVVLGLSLCIIAFVVPIMTIVALIIAGYGSMTDSEALLFDVVGIVLLVSWVAIPVSLLAIAYGHRHSKIGVLIAALGVAALGIAAWVAVSVWFLASGV
jgi:hypothetical protein